MRNLENMKNEFGNVATGNGKYSVGIVNNKNGKRITISAALGQALNLTDKAGFMIDTEAKELLISSSFSYKGAATVNVSGADGQKKIVYSAPIVEAVTRSFQLDFSVKTSMSFGDIYIETDENTDLPYAVVKMQNTAGGTDEDQIDGTA